MPVGEDGPLAAAALGDQDAAPEQGRGVVLHELHVAQRHTLPVGHAHAFTGDDPGIGILAVETRGAAGAQDHGLALEQIQGTGRNFDGQDATDTPVLDDEIGDEELVEALDAGIFERGLEQGVLDVETGLVRGEPGALHLHPAEEAGIDAAVVQATPGAAPVLELDHLFCAVLDEILHRVLIAQPVTTRNGIVEVVVDRIVGTDHAGRAALGRHGVAAHRHHLRDQCHGQPGIGLVGRDRGPQSGPPAPYDDDIPLDDFHPNS